MFRDFQDPYSRTENTVTGASAKKTTDIYQIFWIRNSLNLGHAHKFGSRLLKCFGRTLLQYRPGPADNSGYALRRELLCVNQDFHFLPVSQYEHFCRLSLGEIMYICHSPHRFFINFENEIANVQIRAGIV